jgi:adenylylsulfate kinase
LVDTSVRSLAKATTWRAFAVVLLAAVTWLTTSDFKTVTYITLGYHIIQVFMYYVHERLWHSVSWGKSRGLFIQMTGMSGAGKSTLAMNVADRLRSKGYKVEVIDGDEYRSGLCSDLGFSKEDRNSNIRRLGFVGNVLSRNNVISIIAAINPYAEIRDELSGRYPGTKTVYVKCGLDTLKNRDTKGLYRRALLPDGDPEKVYNFTGISDPFEDPPSPDLVIRTDMELLDESASKLEEFIIKSAR